MIIDSWEGIGKCRDIGKPRVARLHLCAIAPYFTPFKDSNHTRNGEKVYREYFIIVGTDYGYLHNNAGEMRLWGSYSGAYKFLKNNFN